MSGCCHHRVRSSESQNAHRLNIILNNAIRTPPHSEIHSNKLFILLPVKHGVIKWVTGIGATRRESQDYSQYFALFYNLRGKILGFSFPFMAKLWWTFETSAKKEKPPVDGAAFLLLVISSRGSQGRTPSISFEQLQPKVGKELLRFGHSFIFIFKKTKIRHLKIIIPLNKMLGVYET